MFRITKSLKGFTLVEVMITLFIIVVMTSITLITFSSLYKAKEIENILEQLKYDIFLAQQTAISTGVSTYFYIDPHNSTYSIRQRGNSLFIQPIDDRITFEYGTLRLNEIMFNSKGNIAKPGTILIRTDEATYRLIFTLGKGRYYIEKI